MELDKGQITALLNDKAKQITDWFESQPSAKFEYAPGEAWTAGQHLLHLIKSTKPLAKGLAFPRILLLLKFGRVKQPSRDYEGTISFYQDGLKKGGRATGGYVPRETKASEKTQMINRFQGEISALVKAVEGWNDSKLDKAQLPHPLLGNLTVREMLYFTIYHMEHHLTILKERYK